MIAISTAQSQINYVPFVKYGLDYLLLLQTPYAKEKWSKGLKELLGEKCFTLDLTNDEECDVLKIVDRVNAELKKKQYAGAETWVNFGGGQKHHSIALWQFFVSRQKPGDVAVYADQTSGRIMRWYYDHEGKLLNDRTDKFEVELRIEEVLKMYDKHQFIHEDTRQVLARGELFLKDRFKNWMDDESIVSWVLEASKPEGKSKKENDVAFFEPTGFTLEKREKWIKNQRKLVNEYAEPIKKFIYEKVKNNSFNEVTIDQIRKMVCDEVQNLITYETVTKGAQKFLKNSDFSTKRSALLQDVVREYESKKKGAFFEGVVQQVFQNLLEKYKGRNIICEAYANYYITTDGSTDKGKFDAEYDLVFSTRQGRLVVIDAKTLDFEKKDAFARLEVMKQAAGTYTRFIVVIPYFKTEPYHGLMRDRLKELPFELDKMGIPFYVLSEDDRNFVIYRKNSKVYFEPPSDEPYPKGVECNSFNHFFEKEKLLADDPKHSRGTAFGR